MKEDKFPLPELSRRIEIPERVLPMVFCLFAVWIQFIDVFGNTPGYKAATIIPPLAWQVIFAATGIMQFAATNFGGIRLRRGTLFLTSLVWIVWAVLIISAFANGFGAIVYSAVAVMSVWTFIRAEK